MLYLLNKTHASTQCYSGETEDSDIQSVCLTTVLLKGVVDRVLGVAWVSVGVDEGELDVATVEGIGITAAESTFDPSKSTADGTRDGVASTGELLASSDLEDSCTLTAVVDQLIYDNVSIKQG